MHTSWTHALAASHKAFIYEYTSYIMDKYAYIMWIVLTHTHPIISHGDNVHVCTQTDTPTCTLSYLSPHLSIISSSLRPPPLPLPPSSSSSPFLHSSSPPAPVLSQPPYHPEGEIEHVAYTTRRSTTYYAKVQAAGIPTLHVEDAQGEDGEGGQRWALHDQLALSKLVVRQRTRAFSPPLPPPPPPPPPPPSFSLSPPPPLSSHYSPRAAAP